MRASLHAAVHAASPFLASIQFALLPTPALAEQDTILVGAGDIAECWLGFFNGARGAEATATLLDHIGGTVFTIGDTHTAWPALYEFGVDVVVNGHDHDYERFAPKTPVGQPDQWTHTIVTFGLGSRGLTLWRTSALRRAWHNIISTILMR